MARYEGGELGLYPGTEVLINKLGIRDQAELDAAEAPLVLLAAVELAEAPLPEPRSGPGFGYLLRIHEALFRDVYDWAGTVRNVDISKGSTRFANFRHIESEGTKLTDALAAEGWLEHRTPKDFARRMAYYMGELNVLPPFREGNGRALREYVRHLAERAGHSLSWEGVSGDEMVTASIEAYRGNYDPLEALIWRQMARSADE